jgi:predicted nucleotidyltransferase
MALSRKERKAVGLFKASLAERLPGEKVKLLLFGSKARGDDRRGSDIDLMVLLKSDARNVVDQVYETVTETQLKTDVCMSLKPVSRRRFAAWRKKRSPFICNVLQDGVLV